MKKRLWMYLIATGAVTAAFIFFLAWCRMPGAPSVIVDLSSDALSLDPAESVDLVQLARPRFGVNPDGTSFDGLRLDPALRPEDVEASLRFERDLGTDAPLPILRSLVVSPGCEVRIETLPQGWLRFDVLSTQPSDGGSSPATPATVCSLSTQFQTIPSDPDVPPEFISVPRDTVEPRSPASLILKLDRSMQPLVLRRVPVRRLGFNSFESGRPRSSLRSGVLHIPAQGVHDVPLYGGDRLSLGPLQGVISRMTLHDSLTLAYRGPAARPALPGRSLEPSMLSYLMHNDGTYAAGSAVVAVVGTFAVILGTLASSGPAPGTAPAPTSASSPSRDRSSPDGTAPLDGPAAPEDLALALDPAAPEDLALSRDPAAPEDPALSRDAAGPEDPPPSATAARSRDSAAPEDLALSLDPAAPEDLALSRDPAAPEDPALSRDPAAPDAAAPSPDLTSPDGQAPEPA